MAVVGDAVEPRTPAFDKDKVIVIFVLGGPGAGKGTQCAMLAKDFGFCHLSAGDLLRAEQHREGSEYGTLIQTCIKEGKIVPMEVTVKLLENAIRSAMQQGRPEEGWSDGHGRFLIDGFPRKLDQAFKFENQVCFSSLVLLFTTTEEVMIQRLLERGKTSGREDDNVESIKKRFGDIALLVRLPYPKVDWKNDVSATHQEATVPVIEYYNQLGKVAEIDSTGSIDEVNAMASAVVKPVIARQCPSLGEWAANGLLS